LDSFLGTTFWVLFGVQYRSQLQFFGRGEGGVGVKKTFLGPFK